MLFRRRQPQTFWMKTRSMLWPSRSWRRSLSYLKKRVLRLDATPHAVAAGFAAGTFASFTPFIGFHFLLAFAIAYVIVGNMAAAAIGCGVGNPLTFPAIWASTYELGRLMLGAEPGSGATPMGLARSLMTMDFAAMWHPIVKPMLIGSLPMGIGAAGLAYGVLYLAVRSFQRHRTARLGKRRGAGLVGSAPAVAP